MKLTEKILAIAIVIGLVLKFLFVPGGEDLTLIAFLILACIYYPLGFLFFNQIRLRNIFKKKAYENVTVGKIVMAIIVGINLSIVCVGILFKLLILPGADEMLIIGVAGVLFVSILVAIIGSPDRKFTLIRTGVLGITGAILLFTPQLSIVKFQYRNHPAYIEAFANYQQDPGNAAFRNQLDLEQHRVQMTEKEFKEYEENLKE